MCYNLGMKEIKLTQGKVSLIDDEDFELVSRHKWSTAKRGRTSYAKTNIYLNKKQVTLLMHTLITGKTQGLEMDHINHNGLDNRRCNLRHVTNIENHYNSRSRLNHSSIYKGVSWHKPTNKWRGTIGQNGRQYHLGLFTSEKEAALAYNKEAIKIFGEFACLNHAPVVTKQPTD